jgi:hypothetical protein
MTHTWDLNDSLDLLTWHNIWPDTIEDGMVLLNYAYKRIESFKGDGEERIKLNKSIVKKSFDKNYEKS